ncbi:8-oxoguanine deaminase [Litorivicinus lipolyticus]|uniref:8-oxoguanine deaminase n=1 Tax=Litorivicinus lipolyticus TaxID=418701 RepID=UPI003B58D547
MSPTLRIDNLHTLVTMNDDGDELHDVSLYLRGAQIAAIGPRAGMPDADRVIDGRGKIAIPGLVNTHHHLYQNLTRAVPGAQDALLFDWLKTLYPIWGRMRSEHIWVSTQIGLGELALSGCTTSSDHLYIYPNDCHLGDSIEAALALGVRFHPTRGAMSIGESDGGLPPDALVENEDDILRDCQDMVARYHDPSALSMTRVGLAPCSPFSVSRELMRDAALLARELGVGLHTHLAENNEDIDYSLEKFGVRPGTYAEELGWIGADVWHAHCVKLDGGEIDLFARTGTGVAHCPCSNMRLGSGIAPVRAMRDAGVKVGLGVDGSASNDAADLFNEARQAMLLQRVNLGADAMSAREALRIATRGGAEVLNRPQLGQLQVGFAADFGLYDIDQVAGAGDWDPVAALVLCGPMRPQHLYISGQPIVEDYCLTRVDWDTLKTRHSALCRELAQGT